MASNGAAEDSCYISNGVTPKQANSLKMKLNSAEITPPVRAEAEGKAQPADETSAFPPDQPLRRVDTSLPQDPPINSTELLTVPADASPAHEAELVCKLLDSTPQIQANAGEAIEEKPGSKAKGRSRGKSRGEKRAETCEPKELDAEGQKLLDAWEHFQENAAACLNYFE